MDAICAHILPATGGEDDMKPQLEVGLVDAGFIGGSHALAVGAVNRVFADAPLRAVRLRSLDD